MWISLDLSFLDLLCFRICRFMPLVKFEKFSTMISLVTFFFPPFLPSSSRTSDRPTLPLPSWYSLLEKHGWWRDMVLSAVSFHAGALGPDHLLQVMTPSWDVSGPLTEELEEFSHLKGF